MLASGAYFSITGIAAPITVIGAALVLVCTGLLYTLNIGTGEGKWIGYQMIGGVGWGIAQQIPIIKGDLSRLQGRLDGRQVGQLDCTHLPRASGTSQTFLHLYVDPRFRAKVNTCFQGRYSTL